MHESESADRKHVFFWRELKWTPQIKVIKSNTMGRQQKISSFFLSNPTAMAPKRKATSPIKLSPAKATKKTDCSSETTTQVACSNNNKSYQTTSIGETWKEALKAEFTKPYFIKVNEFVDKERKEKTIYPPEKDVFSWTQHTDIQDVKVVILGQDPYHGPRQAHGLCFSVLPGVKPPPSLKNMYKELEEDIPGFKKPSHGYLLDWAKQGVLLLNACLTVEASKANSHQGKGWEKFTDAVIEWINKNLKNVVFVLWGSYAQKKGNAINQEKHLVLRGPHPSPLSAHRGFFGCKHFSKANEYLKEHNKGTIDWTQLNEK